MGQGTESCGGYEVDYDEFEEALDRGRWPARSGDVKLSEMSLQHMKNARRHCQNRAKSCNFSSDADEWERRVDMFDDLINSAEKKASAVPSVPKAPPKPQRGVRATMICHCKAEYTAREAELKRGNGYSCSKRCAAIRREFGRPKAQRKPL